MKKRPSAAPLPSVADIRAWLAAVDERPKASAAARAFGVRGVENRRAFKQLFKQALAGGDVAGERHSRQTGGMPPVTLFRVTRTDSDGAIRAVPAQWEGAEPPPEAIVEAGGAATRLAAGARLIARVEATDDGDWIARPIRILPAQGAFEPELAVVEADRRGRLSLKAARPGRERLWEISGQPPPGLSEGDLVLAHPETPKLSSRGREYRARILSVHGRAADPVAYGLALLAALEAPIAFDPAVVAEADAMAQPQLDGRTDLRDLPLLTIDGADARDFDDAVHASPLTNGWRVVVAIADVCHYVRPGSLLDREAQARGNSTYLPDRAIPMLPEALSNGLCSLKPNEDRACLFVEMTFDAKGARQTARFGRGLMRSHWRLTYEAVAALGDGGEPPEGDPEYAPAVEALYGAYAALSQGRARRAPLELELPERTVIFDRDGAPQALRLRAGLSSHRLIEEFMVQANAAAAEALLAAGAEALYRVHDRPDPERIGLLAETAAQLGAAAPGARLDRPRHLNALLAGVDDPPTRSILSELILRSQAQARYSAECAPHFGLALEAYAHFTSPIRRYPDLVVHRALVRALGLGDGGRIETADALDGLAESVNRTERRSAMVERAVLDRYSALFATEHIGETLDGRIVGANRVGLFIRFNDPLLEGFAPAALLPDDYWRLSRDGMAMEGRRSRKTFRVGDAVSAFVREADAATGSVVVEIRTGKPPQRPGKRFTKKRRR